MRVLLAWGCGILALCSASSLRASEAGPGHVGATPEYQFIEGAYPPSGSPDGNSVLLDAPAGLILVDTGRHAAHQNKLLAYARAHGKPIVAIVNTHWHLDHSGGNAELRALFPEASLIASTAVEGALKSFFPASRADMEAFLKSGQASAEQAAEIRGDLAAIDDAGALRPSEPVTQSSLREIAGRKLQVNLAPFAATEGDVWLYDEQSRLLIAGDLVVGLAPFMDTACIEGWQKALEQIATTPFVTLIPGHGRPMNRAQFAAWHSAFNRLLDCAGSSKTDEECAALWRTDAAQFIPPGEKRVEDMIRYYLKTRLRAKAEDRDKWCPPGSAQRVIGF